MQIYIKIWYQLKDQKRAVFERIEKQKKGLVPCQSSILQVLKVWLIYSFYNIEVDKSGDINVKVYKIQKQKYLEALLSSSMSNKINKTPIAYSFFYHTTGFKKDETNQCVKLFMDHVKKTTRIIPKDVINEISVQILKRVTDQKCKRQLIQAINLELDIEGVQDLFKNLFNSKEISKQEIQQILEKANNKL